MSIGIIHLIALKMKFGLNDFEIMTASLNYIKRTRNCIEYRQITLNTRSRLNNSFSVNGFNANETIILPRFVTFI
jgi:hypothetical protein